MKRFLAILMVGLLGFALVAGCGKKQEEQPPMEQATPEQTTPPADTGTMPDTAMQDTSAMK